MTRVAGLLLAAGASIRMGKPKQLLTLGGRYLLDRILKETLNSELDIVHLVLGHRSGEIKAALKTDLHHPKLRIVENRRYAEGISTSIVAGLQGVEEPCDHLMIILADMPHITSSIINQLLRRYTSSRLPLGAITIKNRRSHPVIIGKSLFPELLKLTGDTGAKGLFLKYADHVCLVEPEGHYDNMDIDTPEDYAEFNNGQGQAGS